MSRLDSAGIAKQSGAGSGGLGTKQTVMEYSLAVESAERGPSIERMTAEETLGHPFPTDQDTGTRYYEPSLSGRARSASFPRLLSPFLGIPLTTTPDAGGAPTARNHNFDPVARPTPQAVSLLLNNDDPFVYDGAALTDLYWDAIGADLSVEVEPNSWIGYDAGFVAKEVDEAQPRPTPTVDLTRRFAFYECKAYLSINGAAEAEIPVGSFGLDYTLNVPTDTFVLGSAALYRIRPGNRDATVRFVPRTNIAAWFRRAVALGDQDDLKIRLEALGPTIAAAIKHKIEFIAHRCHVQEAPVDIDAGETLEGVEVSARCAYDATATKFVEANVVNTVASY